MVVAAAGVPPPGSGAAGAAGVPPRAPAAAVAAGPASWAAAPSPDSSAARFVANFPMIRPPTSAITPRPNWAGRPVTVMVVRTRTRVWPFSSCREERIVADAVPLPRVSLPDASSTTVFVVSSFSVKRACARVGHLDRADLDLDLARDDLTIEGVDGGAGHAGRHLLDVQQGLPGLLRGNRDDERVLQIHVAKLQPRPPTP